MRPQPVASPNVPLAVISLIYFTVFLGNSIWRTTFNNYAVESLHLNGQQVATLFSIAAVPGVLAFSVGLLSSRLRLYLLVALTSTLLGGGLIWTGQATGWGTLALGVFGLATGFTFFYPIANSVGILASEAGTTALMLGRLKSFGPLAGLGAALVLLLFVAPGTLGTLWDSLAGAGTGNFLNNVITAFTSSPRLQSDAPTLRALFSVVGAMIIVVGLLGALTIHRARRVDIRSKLRLQPALWPYYLLNFLAGCRSGLFQAFVLFVLIDRYGLRIHGTALLVLCGHLFSFAGYRLIGRLTRVWSARYVLMGLYTVVAFNFLGFALLIGPRVEVDQTTLLPLMALFLIDSLVFGASVITDASLRRPQRTPSLVGDLATGTTIYYLGVAAMPVAGSALVARFDYCGVFAAGTALAMIAIVVSHWLPANSGSIYPDPDPVSPDSPSTAPASTSSSRSLSASKSRRFRRW